MDQPIAAMAAALEVRATGEGGQESNRLWSDLRREKARADEAEQEARQYRRELGEAGARAAELEKQLAEKAAELELREKAFQDAKRVVEEAKAQVARSRQELDQQRRRHQAEAQEVRRNASQALLERLFPVLDNFYIAAESIQSGGDPENLVKGITMIATELMAVLEGEGFRRVGAVGEGFDPKVHDAVATEEVPDKPDGVVLSVLRPGYQLNDKVLRAAMVLVNKLPAALPTEGKVREASTPQDDGDAVPPAAAPNPPIPGPSDSNVSPIDRARRMLETRYEESDED